MKNIDTEAGRNNATSEIAAIFETIRSVKGKEYAAIVRGTFAICNYHQAIEQMRQFIAEGEAQNAFNILQTAHSVAIQDVTRTMIQQYIGPCVPDGHCVCDAKFAKVLAEISDDVKALSAKQDEYGAFAFGEPHP